jgi:tetratricopeptide (TPR) repeat protein
MNCRFVLERAALATVSLLFASGRIASQQPPPGCPGGACVEAHGQAWQAATDIYRGKQEFVVAIRRFAVALSGTFGDEGPRLRADVDAMAEALRSWDRAIAAFEKDLQQGGHDADDHVALGSAYLDRFRVDEAIREFETAARLDPARADVHRLVALAHGLVNRPSDAIGALRTAVSLQPEDPVQYYELARYAIDTGRRTDALAALVTFREVAANKVSEGSNSNDRAALFTHLGLLRQVPGVAPIFPPADYVAAFESLMKGAFDEAISRCRRAVETDPLLEASGNRTALEGSAALRRGDLSAALGHLRAAADADPDRSEPHRVLAMALRLDEQFDRSLEEYRAAIRQRPTDERSRIALADLLASAERFADAEQVLKETVRDVPGTVLAHYRLGRLYQSLANYPAAVAELEQAARVTPLAGQDPLYEMIAAIHVTRIDFSAAASALRRQIAANPNNADAHRKLGDVEVRLDRSDEALAEYSAALLIDPRNADSQIGIGQVHLQASRFSEAARAARKAVDLDPSRREARYVLAMSLTRLGETERGSAELAAFQRLQAEAAASTRRRYEIDGVRREITVRLANADYAKAIPLLRQAIAQESAVASDYVNLGDALLKTGETEQAIENLQQAAQLQPANADLHRRLAEAYRQAGQADASRREADLYRASIESAKRERLLRLATP